MMRNALIHPNSLRAIRYHPLRRRTVSCRWLSNTPVQKEEPVFEYPKAQALFEKITANVKTKEEFRQLQEELMRSLGREPLDKYFYFDGFGGKGGGGKKGAASAAEPEAPTAVDVKLVGFDAKAKIKVIKEVRSLLGLGLKEAKELVESAPTVLQKQMKPEAAEELKGKLVELGAQIELV